MLQIRLQRGCYELDPVDMPIEICQLTGQLDQVQKHLFENILRYFITSVIMLFYVVELCCVPFFPMSFTMKTLKESNLKESNLNTI